MRSSLSAFSETKFRPFFFPRGKGGGGGSSIIIPTGAMVVLDALNIEGSHHSPVTTWPDSSGNERDGVAEKAGARLDLSTMESACLDLTPELDNRIVSPIPDGGRPYTIIMVCQLASVSENKYAFAIQANSTVKGLVVSNGSEWRMYQSGSFQTMGVAPTTNPTILVSIFNGASSKARVNGVEKLLNQGTSDSGTRSSFTIGWKQASANSTADRVAYAALIDGVIDPEELTTLEEALAERYNITLA